MTTAQQIERLRQGSTRYALGSMGSTARQLSLLKAPFAKVMSTLAIADSHITCTDCGEPMRKHEEEGMKASERLDQMVAGSFGFAQENLLRAAREMRALGGNTEQIQSYLGKHIDCADKHEQEREQQHGPDHEQAVPGPVVVN